jgi:hypothetical protein
MAATVRRPAAAAPAIVGVNFGDMDMYHAGGGIPEGDYVWAEVNVQMYQATNANGVTSGPNRLGVMIHLQSMAEPGAEFKTQFYSMGDAASKSFAPNPQTGKGVVPVAGGPASTFNNMSNFAVLLKSLYDAGLPQGIFSNDTTVLEGMHCHMAPQPPPKEREGFKSKTAEVQEEFKVRDILVVTEIKEDGKPWENTGGLLEAGAAAPAAPAAAKPATAARPAARPAAAAAPAAAAPAEAGADDEGIMAAASDGITSVLEANPDGCTKLALRMGTKKAVTTAQGVDMAEAVIAAYFSDDAALNRVLGTLGFKVAGPQVKPA